MTTGFQPYEKNIINENPYQILHQKWIAPEITTIAISTIMLAKRMYKKINLKIRKITGISKIVEYDKLYIFTYNEMFQKYINSYINSKKQYWPKNTSIKKIRN